MYSKIKYWVIDVDGTLTDGGVYYDNQGNELKKFNTKDGVGLLAIKEMGMEVIVITGRSSFATEKRMPELKVKYLFQNIKNKVTFLKKFMEENDILQEELAYIGDDLNDYAAMELAGFRACPSDACEEIKKIVHYISPKKGGDGAVRDVIFHILQLRGERDICVKQIHDAGI